MAEIIRYVNVHTFERGGIRGIRVLPLLSKVKMNL